jgi:DNA polymerase IV
LPVQKTQRKSLGHSHVLPPNLRTDQGCRDVLLRLIQKASARLRANHLCAGSMTVRVGAFDRMWEVTLPLGNTSDTLAINEVFLEAWKSRDFHRPRSVSVTFHRLSDPVGITPSLFEEEVERDELNRAVDRINQKFGKNTIYVAAIEKTKNRAQERIAFNKTWLFSEGKGDNEIEEESP